MLAAEPKFAALTPYLNNNLYAGVQWTADGGTAPTDKKNKERVVIACFLHTFLGWIIFNTIIGLIICFYFIQKNHLIIFRLRGLDKFIIQKMVKNLDLMSHHDFDCPRNSLEVYTVYCIQYTHYFWK